MSLVLPWVLPVLFVAGVVAFIVLDGDERDQAAEPIPNTAMGHIDIIARAFTGYRTEGDRVIFDPVLPHGLAAAGFQLQHRGQRLQVALDRHTLTATADPCAGRPQVQVQVAGIPAVVPGGEARSLPTHRPREDQGGPP